MKASVATGAAVVAGAAAATAGLYHYLSARVAGGSDHAVRLAAVLPYVGIDRSYTMARALGVTALGCAYLSAATGLVAATARSRGGTREALPALHRQLGLAALALAAAHAAVPYTSVLPPYGGWRTSLVPFGQPVSWGMHAATEETFGILALYLAVLTGPTYYLLRGRHRTWVAVHRANVVIYSAAVTHVFLLGTDFVVAGPARVAVVGAQVPLLLLAARRVLGAPGATARTRALAAAAAAASIALACYSAAIATGAASGGRRL